MQINIMTPRICLLSHQGPLSAMLAKVAWASLAMLVVITANKKWFAIETFFSASFVMSYTKSLTSLNSLSKPNTEKRKLSSEAFHSRTYVCQNLSCSFYKKNKTTKIPWLQWILQDILLYCRIMQNFVEYHGILQDIAGYCRILQDISGYCRKYQDI